MVIREIQTAELPELFQLYQQLNPDDDPYPPSSVLDETWDSIQRDPNLTCFGTLIDDKLVSTCTLTVIPNLTRGCRPYGLIENVVTDASYRGRGIGRAIMQHALDTAWERGCYKVMLLTGRKDEAIFQFYESVGFDRFAKQGFIAKPVN